MKMWIEACHGVTDAGGRAAVQDDDPEAAEIVSVAESYVGDHATEILQDCVQMHGGIGVTWEHDLHLYLRRVTLDREPVRHAARAPRTHRRGARRPSTGPPSRRPPDGEVAGA